MICKHCGYDVPAGRLACPECGSDWETGWSNYWAGQGPDTQESTPPRSRIWRKLLYVAAAVVLLLCFFEPIPSVYVALALGMLIGFYAAKEIYPRTRFAREKMLYRVLLKHAGGDRKLVEKLIDFERTMNPQADMTKLLRDAIFRMEMDRE